MSRLPSKLQERKRERDRNLRQSSLASQYPHRPAKFLFLPLTQTVEHTRTDNHEPPPPLLCLPLQNLTNNKEGGGRRQWRRSHRTDGAAADRLSDPDSDHGKHRKRPTSTNFAPPCVADCTAAASILPHGENATRTTNNGGDDEHHNYDDDGDPERKKGPRGGGARSAFPPPGKLLSRTVTRTRHEFQRPHAAAPPAPPRLRKGLRVGRRQGHRRLRRKAVALAREVLPFTAAALALGREQTSLL